MSTNPTALSYWFPKIREAGLPVPKTIILTMTKPAMQSIWAALEGQTGSSTEQVAIADFLADLARAVAEVGTPAFLRTDHTSNKHAWERSCFIEDIADLPSHMMKIVDFSEMVDILGLPWSTWAVREFLPIRPVAICPRYGNMPVNREFRFFVRDGKVECFHPYWPRQALVDGGLEASPAATIDRLRSISESTEDELRTLACRAGEAVGGGYWSVDILDTARGWFITDMAEGEKSWHWPGCPVAEGQPVG